MNKEYNLANNIFYNQIINLIDQFNSKSSNTCLALKSSEEYSCYMVSNTCLTFSQFISDIYKPTSIITSNMFNQLEELGIF